ncbi:MAG: hypothetical protein DRQ88_11870 [Epsilonproteobacteria bacterium]|nr:MAG: hypothetical protein DRQ89_11725 [Campylobacterota bacterium]RLA63856.1 MAG: hypothetical protein DRQ88_11870 [Campylobacterota bacterium]
MRLLLLILTLAMAVSCGPNLSSHRTITEEAVELPPTVPPTFPSTTNYFKNGDIQASKINIPVNFNTTLKLMGREIDDYIRNHGSNDVVCLVSRYEQSLQKNLFVQAAKPTYINDFATNTQEFFYLLEPNSDLENSQFCNTSGINQALANKYPNQEIAYSLLDICPSCPSQLLIDSGAELLLTSGYSLSTVMNVTYDFLDVDLFISPDTNLGSSCTNSNECTAKGFDCCSSGICVKDGQIKPGVDIYADLFLQSQRDLESSSCAFHDYPDFYFVCSISQGACTSPETPATEMPDPSPEDEAVIRLQTRKELYECTTPQLAEESWCTIVFPDSNDNVLYPNFFTGNDDRNFTSTYSGKKGISELSILKVIHAGSTLFDQDEYVIPGAIEFGPSNDNLTDPTSVTINHEPSEEATNETLRITYKIDGSCEEVNNYLAKCFKEYIQGQNEGEINDHFPASNKFFIPFYADLNRNLKVTINEVDKLVNIHWKLIKGQPAYIEFLGDNLQVSDTENVRISFFVNTSLHKVMQMKNLAQQEIDRRCDCGGEAGKPVPCWLKPVYSSIDQDQSTPINYQCTYSGKDQDQLLQVSINLSSKSTPNRYFDINGVAQAKTNINTPDQEGKKFEYLDTKFLAPNNVDQYIGFNEINGSYTLLAGSAKPASEVMVETGKTYDIFVDSGIFSTCFNCGRDYYNQITRLFPDNFNHQGGGYLPDPLETSRNNTPTYRADDLIFGRACFLPATMIPWSHRPKSEVQDQRQSRQAAQHFLFANGYNRDWYGFDYGSVIASFDGVQWFSVGTQRRIKAKSNRLFLAINSYFGDLTTENNFTIVVSDASHVPFSGSAVNNDFLSTGAQCQQYHLCQSDKDCMTQLGYDYLCEEVSNATTNWPIFDSNADEQLGKEQRIRMTNIVGGSLIGGSKRCVYRGRGAPCVPNYTRDDSTNLYSGTKNTGLNSCSNNNYCQNFEQGVLVNDFNNKIARWGRSVDAQNAAVIPPESDLDTFGLQSRIITRPFSYNGEETINLIARPNLAYNLVNSICLPGRDPLSTNTSIEEQHSTRPAKEFNGDQVLGIGNTPEGNTARKNYLSSCAILEIEDDQFINYYNLNREDAVKALGNDELAILAGSQAIPTNSVDIIQNMSGIDKLKNFSSEQITQPFLQYNRCLRAAGSPCHTNLDCGPSEFISASAKGIDANDLTKWSSVLNRYEILYWQEELVCGQMEKAELENPNYFLSGNKCCREIGKNITIGSLIDQVGISEVDPMFPVFNNFQVPGIDLDLDDEKRYSRISTVYNKFNDPETKDGFPPLEGMGKDKCESGNCGIKNDLDYQFNTFSEMAAKTCCSGHWVRNFNDQENGGGHLWGPTKTQVVDKKDFNCYNWRVCTEGKDCNNPQFSCSESESPADPTCLARSISDNEALPILNWIGTLELTGIPQISVLGTKDESIYCSTTPELQSLAGTGPRPNILEEINQFNAEYSLNGSNSDLAQLYYSALDMDNFAPDIKKIFSPDTVTCCLPAGSAVELGADPNNCCTGFINPNTNKCALPDYTDVSIYFNRYVSSEAGDIGTNQVDQETGYLVSTSTVEELACVNQVCASGKVGRGVAISNLKVPGHEDNEANVSRFVVDDLETSAVNKQIADFYNAGLRWNNHVYCVPEDLQSNPTTGLTVFDCGAFTGTQ